MTFYLGYKVLVIGFTVLAVFGLYCENINLVLSGLLFAILCQLAAIEEKKK